MVEIELLFNYRLKDTTTTMPSTNYAQPTTNAKSIAELFPLLSERAHAAPLELSQQQMQTLLRIALATTTHFFGPPARYLAGVDDPRDPGKIIYPLPCLLFTGLLMFLCHLAARRQITLKFRDNPASAANFERLFGVPQAPHGDTLNYTFSKLKPQQAQECVTRLVEILIRKKYSNAIACSISITSSPLTARASAGSPNDTASIV